MILPWLILIPFIGGLLCWLGERFGATLPRWIALLTMSLLLGIGLWLWGNGDYTLAPAPGAEPAWALEYKVQWIQRFGISIHLALDGLSLLMILLTGLLAANFIGQKLVVWWEKLLARIPVVNSVYNSVKQVSDTLFSPNGNAFRKALLVQYPREGSWTVAFLTGAPGGDIVNHLEGEHVSVYVPTTPNPTSGFFLMMPAKDVVELDMTVDEALKYIISMGVVAPPPHPRAVTNT